MFNLFERMETHTESTIGSTGCQGNDDDRNPEDYDHNVDDEDDERQSQQQGF